MFNWLMKQGNRLPAKGPVFRKESWRRGRAVEWLALPRLYRANSTQAAADHVWLLQLQAMHKLNVQGEENTHLAMGTERTHVVYGEIRKTYFGANTVRSNCSFPSAADSL